MNQPQLPDVIRYLMKCQRAAALEVNSLSKYIGMIRDDHLLEEAEKELAEAQRANDCLSAAIHTLKGLA